MLMKLTPDGIVRAALSSKSLQLNIAKLEVLCKLKAFFLPHLMPVRTFSLNMRPTNSIF